MKHLVGFFVLWVGFVGLWLLFVYQVTMPELFSGGGAAALTVFGLNQSLKAEPLCFKPKLNWFTELWRMPAVILRDSWVLLQTLVRHAQRKPSEALFQVIPFRNSGDGSHQGAQRCITTVFMSVSPNSIVVDIDTKNNFLMFHQVKRAPAPAFIRKLEQS